MVEMMESNGHAHTLWRDTSLCHHNDVGSSRVRPWCPSRVRQMNTTNIVSMKGRSSGAAMYW